MPDYTYGRTLRERLLSRLIIDPSGCVLWTGAQTTGYGRIHVDGRQRTVHVVMWEMFEGPVPEGLQLDHLCRVRNCANLTHLEPVTPRVNTLRGNTFQARNAAKTHCDNGHEFTEANTYRAPRGRGCRTCRNEAARRWDRAHRAERVAIWRAYRARKRAAS